MNAGGWVFAEGNGTATIEAAVGEISDGAAVVVEQVAASVRVSPGSPRLGEGETVTLSAVVEDANGEAIPEAGVTWSSAEPAIATVDAGGAVTARREGVVRIEARADGVAGGADVDVMGKIVFSSDATGTRQIYVANEDGSGVVQLTDAATVSWQPAWSPDGTRIAFRSNRVSSGTYGVFTIGTDGSALTEVTSGSQDIDPAWSPDGSRIAFVSQRDGDEEVYLMNADGTGVTNLTNDPDADDDDPSWSPDGQRIIFSSDRDGDDELYWIDVDGTGLTRVTDDTDQNRSPHQRPAPGG